MVTSEQNGHSNGQNEVPNEQNAVLSEHLNIKCTKRGPCAQKEMDET
ncbi:hypothetical protein SAMN05880501_1089 [Ureibacillus xyleni]|uniref:Uncharacterized protein n=1 Tax=Ureibacillus xyleni TaxID=614648 RepID=A0A285T146_9BACL|nr:hypothetical protein [Ureibacillus xyleni]SOC14952.1 hypothetical protein SAMN05880501_1089 [Ureibacillus xyleni]